MTNATISTIKPTYYYIYVEYYYNLHTYRAPQSGKLCHEQYEYKALMLFETRELAEKELEDRGIRHYYTTKSGKKLYAQAGTYVTSNGEYDRPDYAICATKKTEYKTKKYDTTIFIKSA